MEHDSYADFQRLLEDQSRSFKFAYRSLDFPIKAAKRLRRCLASSERSPDITTGRARALVAQLAGYLSWERLKSGMDPDSTDRIDQDLSTDELVLRRAVQTRRLAKLAGISTDLAAHVVSLTEPTGSATGLLRWDDGCFFETGKFPVGINAWDALEAEAVIRPSSRRLLCYDIFKSVFRDDRSDAVTVEAQHPDGVALQISVLDQPHLHVEYDREIDLSFGFPHDIVFAGEDGYMAHPSPLRPKVSERMDVTYSLRKVSILKRGRGLQTAFEHAAGFILLDLLQTSSLCAQSSGCEIKMVDPSIDTNFDDGDWYRLAECIASSYEDVLSSDEENRDDPDGYIDLENGWCLLSEIAPFPPRIVLTDE